MIDATIIYYTSNQIHEYFAENIRKKIVESSGNKLPIISVSQKPINFGKNICVGKIGVLVYNVYKQILAGAKKAETKFVMCAEDDTLYPPEHFKTTRPQQDRLYYNTHRWTIDPSNVYFFRRHKISMLACIAPTDMLIDILETRFKMFPEPVPKGIFQPAEPGMCEKYFDLPKVHYKKFATKQPIVTFSHRGGLGGRRKIVYMTDKLQNTLEPWGKASVLWEKIYGNS